MDLVNLSKTLFAKYGNYQAINVYLESCTENLKSASNQVVLDEFNSTIDMDEFVELYGLLYEISLNNGSELEKRKQKDYGIYFTESYLSDLLSSDILDKSNYEKAPLFLEPSAGMGSFVFAYIRIMFAKIDDNSKPTKFTKQDVINSIFFAEKDLNTAETLFSLINKYIKLKYSNDLVFPKKNMYAGDAIYDHANEREENLLKRFNVPSGFDIVITNPPYRLLKATQNDSEDLRLEIESLKKMLKSVPYFDNISGINNLYKIFVCKIMFELVQPNGFVGLVIPRSLMTDHQSSDLRKRILSTRKIGKIYDVPEGSVYFKGIGQAFTLLSFSNEGSTKEVQLIQLNKDGSLSNSSSHSIRPISFYENITNDLSIIPLSDSDAEFLQVLSKCPRTKDCPQVVNLRGELDISLDKKYISETETPYKFVQGIDIDFFKLKTTKRFVRTDFLPRPKDKWIHIDRIACQQISNFSQERRLKWTVIPKEYILGNSCNFVAIDHDSIFQDKDPVLNTYLLAVFNSFFMNKWFRLLSSNNHVSNTEIANMPLVIPELSIQTEIDFIVRKLQIKYSKDLHLELENKLCAIFNLQISSSDQKSIKE